MLLRLNAAIAQFAHQCGPVTFAAHSDKGIVMLTAKYPLTLHMMQSGIINDCAWTQYGGNQILRQAGLEIDQKHMRVSTKKGQIMTEWVTLTKKTLNQE